MGMQFRIWDLGLTIVVGMLSLAVTGFMIFPLLAQLGIITLSAGTIVVLLGLNGAVVFVIYYFAWNIVSGLRKKR